VSYVAEPFTDEERSLLAPHFTDLDGPVFALTNLPEVVKGALFARYSRSAKSLRRLFLDEFVEASTAVRASAEAVGTARAERLYQNVFLEFGDDSVAQLGGAHIACEQSSQLLAKVLERGRLAAYLEQSTRYVPYDDRPGGRWRYHVPPEVIEAGDDLTAQYRDTLDFAFETYARSLGPLQEHFRALLPQEPGTPDGAYRSTIRAKACDALRGLLPAATTSNVGMFAAAQSYEQLLLRMRAHPLAEVRACGDQMLTELRKVIPAFLTRVDREDRGIRWSEYLGDTRDATTAVASELLRDAGPDTREEVTLTDFDPDGEVKVVAAALYAASDLPDDQSIVFSGSRLRPVICPGKRPFRSSRAPPARCPPTNACERCGPPSETERTAATSRGGRSNGPHIGSISSATTVRSATSSATERSPSNGSSSPPATASNSHRRSNRPAPPPTSVRSWHGPPTSTRCSCPRASAPSPSTPSPWPTASGSSWT